MSENTNAGRAYDPVRDKYVHAVSWDYTSRDPQVARLRERLAAEYDGRPATPAGMDAGRFMDSSRLAVRTLFERMASHGLLAGPDGLYAAMFPFPDMPCIGDLIVMDALSAGLRGTGAADGRRPA
ncbi:hypothetical protein [Bifidobacterium breve]|uniref:Uncharacterized protein n=1 Tax=Bifidobacterium breve TaxID=1685 RepID=A0A2K9BHN5_BIFBR|nr:hypothetical protein [Bifidobacterium breve]AUE03159.1 hypothetical protein BB215W447A_1143 [Bifidobacterium breve]GDZ42495.1 hypothetical protein MCC01966_10610 [Bifidobacteriaceae bacterium MCC01966]